ncbi:alpha-L-rhamnosidase [Paenibacillus sp. RC67]|uniref:alpha-L-rhamnosidase n=1 Tax=Paenibacillus sp. RC67 TaxID=3039392 RepID=UPI0024ADA4FA|nr:alpha-L-rhamnosidase [Paenibacillus sp. RC67]
MQFGEMLVESKICPIGIDAVTPSFSWSYKKEPIRAQLQTAYRILVSTSAKGLQGESSDIWDSGKIESRKNVHIEYKGTLLLSRQRYYWKMQVWDQNDKMIESPVSWWEMGLLDTHDWSASWIGEPDQEHDAPTSLPLFRHEFTLDRPVARARAYVCGLGHFELRLNGSKISDNVLEPGWTNYHKTCLYCVYDVTDDVHEGSNAVGVMLGNGFYNVTGGRYRKYKGSFGKPKCLVQLEITYADGTTLTVPSHPGWRTSSGPITFSCIYGGEDFDARLMQRGWDQPGFQGHASWKNAALVEAPAGRLKSQGTSPLKVMKTFQPVSFSQPSSGLYVADLGQNFSGWVELSVQGPAGTKVTLTPAELLKEDGTVNQKWTGSPTKLNYTLDGSGEEVWQPRFTYTGFRYVQIEGAVPSALAAERVPTDSAMLLRLEGQMIYPDTPVTGSFSCSDMLLNRTHELINWSILSNMKSIFTDCPHREKLCWLEQIHLMGPSVAYNYQIESLLVKSMEDIRDAQLPNGMVPTTAPEYVVFSEPWHCFRDSVSWGAAYVLTAWNLYRIYGNTRTMKEHYPGMKAYIEYVTQGSGSFIVQGGLGDWYDVGVGDPGFAKNTPVSHTETAIYYHMVDIFAQMAGLLNYQTDSEQYEALRGNIKTAFNDAFFHPETTSYATGSQASNALPLVIGLVDDKHKKTVLTHLLEDIRLHGNHTTAGDVGHRYVLLALAMNGRSDVIYEMTRTTDHPSYGYQIAHGATSLTEAWDGPTVGKSQNHFMLGHLEEWLYQGLTGIHYQYEALTDSFQITIKPFLPYSLDKAKAEHLLPVGSIRVEWQRREPVPNELTPLTLKVTIPVNCNADVFIPTVMGASIKERGIPLGDSKDIEFLYHEAGYSVVRLLSGQYEFVSVI